MKTLPTGIRLVIWSFLDTIEVLTTIGSLNKKERSILKPSDL